MVRQSVTRWPTLSTSSLGKVWNALAFRAAREVNESAAVAAIGPELQAGPADDDERLLLRPVGNLLQTDAQSGSHSTLLPDRESESSAGLGWAWSEQDDRRAGKANGCTDQIPAVRLRTFN